MGPDKELVKEIELLEGEIRNMDRQMMIMRMNRGSFVDEILGSVDDIDSALADMDEKLMMKVNALKAIINKFDSENSIPDPDSMD